MKPPRPLPKQRAEAVFLDPVTAMTVLLDDSVEEFIAALSPRAARATFGVDARVWAESVSEPRRQALLEHCVVPFTDAERELLSQLVDALVHMLGEEYPTVAAPPWEFAKLAPGVSADTFVFTRGSCIFLPELVLQRMLNAAIESEAALSLLAHEKLHILQRLTPEPFQRLYREVWGCRWVRQIDWGGAHRWFEFKYLPNPDALDFWAVPPEDEGIWTLTVPILSGCHQPGRLGELLEWFFPPSMLPFSFAVIEVALEGETARVRTDGKGRPVLRPGGEAHLTAGASGSLPPLTMDHPNEVSADLFGTLMAAGWGTSPEPYLAAFEQWCRSHLR